MNSLRAYIACFLSYFKKDWNFQDYPLEIWRQSVDPKFVARFIKWPQLVGLGITEADAVANLRESFERYRKQEPLPRPGTEVPILLASALEVEKLEALHPDALREFFTTIIGIDRDECLFTDESTIEHFDGAFNKSTQWRLEEINRKYGINLSGSDDLRIVAVVTKIATNQK